jgi:hypothetical protein
MLWDEIESFRCNFIESFAKHSLHQVITINSFKARLMNMASIKVQDFFFAERTRFFAG